MSLIDLVPWLLSAWTVLTLELLARMNRWGFVSGLASQGLWLVFDWRIGAYGLMPLALILGWRYVAGWRRWSKLRPLD